MSRGKGQKRREAAYKRAHENPNTTLPPPPTAGKGGDIQGDHYIPRSLRNLLEAKARLAGRQKRRQVGGPAEPGNSLHKGTEPLHSNRQQDSSPFKGAQSTKVVDQQVRKKSQPSKGHTQPVQAQPAKKALREGRARYLKAKKEKDKQKKQRADDWAQQTDPGLQNKPVFGEQTQAPPKAAIKRKHWSGDTQAAAALDPSGHALQQAAAQMQSSAALMDAKRQKADSGRATMASLKRLVAQQAANKS